MEDQRSQPSPYPTVPPRNQPEADLVDQMIAATWRLRRLAAYEALPAGTRAHFAFEKLTVDSGVRPDPYL